MSSPLLSQWWPLAPKEKPEEADTSRECGLNHHIPLALTDTLQKMDLPDVLAVVVSLEVRSMGR